MQRYFIVEAYCTARFVVLTINVRSHAPRRMTRPVDLNRILFYITISASTASQSHLGYLTDFSQRICRGTPRLCPATFLAESYRLCEIYIRLCSISVRACRRCLFLRYHVTNRTITTFNSNEIYRIP